MSFRMTKMIDAKAAAELMKELDPNGHWRPEKVNMQSKQFKFPQPLQISKRRQLWNADEVQAHIQYLKDNPGTVPFYQPQAPVQLINDLTQAPDYKYPERPDIKELVGNLRKTSEETIPQNEVVIKSKPMPQFKEWGPTNLPWQQSGHQPRWKRYKVDEMEVKTYVEIPLSEGEQERSRVTTSANQWGKKMDRRYRSIKSEDGTCWELWRVE